MEYDKIISLGNTCHTALMIRAKYFNDTSDQNKCFFDEELFKSNNFKQGSYLFDWVQSFTINLSEMLKLELDDFVDINNFEITRSLDSYRTVLWNKKFKVYLPHFDKYIKRGDARDEKQKKDVWGYVKTIFNEKIKKYEYLVEKTKKTLSDDNKILFVLFDYEYNQQIVKDETYYEILNELGKHNCKASLLVIRKNENISIPKSLNPNLFFKNVNNVKGWNPHLEYEYWMTAMSEFKFKI